MAWWAYRRGVGLFDAQIAEVVDAIDMLLGGGVATVGDDNVVGMFDRLGELAGLDGGHAGGAAHASLLDAHRDLSSGVERIARADEVVASSVSVARRRSAEVRSRLAGLRAELLELSGSTSDAGSVVGIQRELAEAVLGHAMEVRRICADNAQFSSDLGRSMTAAAGLYRP